MKENAIFALVVAGLIGLIIFMVALTVLECDRESTVRAVSVDGHDYIVNGNDRFIHLRSCWCFTNMTESVEAGR